MANISDWSADDWGLKLKSALQLLVKKWYILALGLLVGGFIGYLLKRNTNPTYTATISFVLSTESKNSGAGLAGISAQLGLDAGITSTDNVFTGDNIIELFKSKKMITQALLSEIDTATHQSLLNYIAIHQYPSYRGILPFQSRQANFSPAQNSLLQNIIKLVGNSFIAFKKDKKLVFYYISASSDDEKTAYYIARCMLDQTSGFFIQTKTSAATRGLKLLTKEADSISRVLGGTFHSTASMSDRTFNVNPSLMVQRSGAQLNQAKALALGTAYTEVMRNIEVARINVQKETPLFSIIDEDQRPLTPQPFNILKFCIITAMIGLVFTALIVAGIHMFFSKNK